jgi:hypothetical protein
MRWLLYTVLGIVCLVASASGHATVPAADQAELIKSLLQRIDKLEKRVDELESNKARPSGACPPNTPVMTASAVDPPALPPQEAPAPAPAPATQAATHEHDQAAPAQEQPNSPSFPSLQIRGFGDVDFSATNQPGVNSGFDLGQFTLHMTSPLSRKVSFFGEVTFTAQPSAYEVQVERTIIRYDYNDFFKLSFGKYHTPINYWNTAFHHGLWLQTTISRPEMIQFGGIFQPVHFVGLLSEGEIPSGGVGLNYQVGLGNGRNENIARAGDSGDINNNRAWVFNVFARPVRAQGLQVGASMYRDEITSGILPRTQELISSAHIVWVRETPEFLAEFANVRHFVPQNGQTFNSQAYYFQVAYRLPWFEKKWKPYYRYEHIHIPAGDPIFCCFPTTILQTPLPGFPSLMESTAGIRYDITDFAAFKGEYRNFQLGRSQPWFNGVFFQTAFTF